MVEEPRAHEIGNRSAPGWRPVPTPPATRWPTAEPFVPYAQPETAARVEAVASPSLTPFGPVVEREADEAERYEGAMEPVLGGAASPTSGSKPGRRAWRLAELRQEGLAAEARLRSERAEREAERAAQRSAANVVESEESLSVEESRSRARRAVVSRADNNWKTYLIVKAERQRWLAAGLGHDRAHIPRMCRIFDARGWGISPSNLGVQLPNGRTVLQEFEAGSNIVQVLDLLSVVRKREFNGSFDARASVVVPVLRQHPPERPLVGPPPPLSIEPAGVPMIADYLLGFTRPSPDERAIDTFNREAKGFERTGRLGPLVKLYSEAHGVFDDPELTYTLLQNVPVHVSDRRPRLPFANLINDALRERQFYYLSATATAAIEEDADRRIPVPDEYELPTPTGFALLRAPDEDYAGAVRILLWSHGAGELTAAILSMADLVDGLVEYPAVNSARTGSGCSDHAITLVSAIAVATRRLASGDESRDESRSPQRLGGGYAKPRAAKRTVYESGEPIDFVSLIYAPGEPHFEQEAATSTGRKAEKRWVVRGHWRQQWYSSRGERQPLWIKAHEAGAVDGELLLRDRVKVAR